MLVLAGAVADQWSRAAAERRLLSPAPVPVRWSLTGLPVAGPAVGSTVEGVAYGVPYGLEAYRILVHGEGVIAVIDPIPFPFSLIQGWRYAQVGFQPGEPDYPSAVLRADAVAERAALLV